MNYSLINNLNYHVCVVWYGLHEIVDSSENLHINLWNRLDDAKLIKNTLKKFFL